MQPEVLQKGLAMIWCNIDHYFFPFEEKYTLKCFNCSRNVTSFEELVSLHASVICVYQRRGIGAHARICWRCGMTLSFLPHFYHNC